MTIYSNKGYALLFSLVVSTVVLSIATFILTTSRKQFILSSMAHNSTVSIYAADSGMQCAMEANNNDVFTSTSSDPVFTSCGSYSVSKESGWTDADDFDLQGEKQARFKIIMGDTCANVFVNRGNFTETSPTLKISDKTVIQSIGYNMTDGTNCPELNPRTEERALMAVYSEPLN